MGENDTTIAAINADGVALAAIKAQQEMIAAQHSEIEELKVENKDHRSRLEKIEAVLVNQGFSIVK